MLEGDEMDELRKHRWIASCSSFAPTAMSASTSTTNMETEMSWNEKGTIGKVLENLEVERTRSYRGPVEAVVIQGQIEAIRALPSGEGGEWRVAAYGHITTSHDGERARGGSNACIDARFVIDGAENPF